MERVIPLHILKSMAEIFDGVIYLPPEELGISQLYISAEKLKRVSEWFSPSALEREPLPVHDFGNGRYTLTDGHTRAFHAWRSGMKAVPVIYDTDDIITCEEGQLLYRMDIGWCDWHGLKCVSDLEARVVDAVKYRKLWNDRCDAGYELMTRTTAEQRESIALLHPDKLLFGADSELKTFFFEDKNGRLFVSEAM